MNAYNLDELITFLKVVEVGSFTAAARELGVTQSTASRRIAELENRLACQLIQRTTRRLLLTDAGERYAESIKTLLSGFAEAETGLVPPHMAPQGLIRIAIPTGFGRTVVLPILTDFARKNPLVRIDIELSDRYVDLLSDGYDFAIRLSEPETTGLQVQRAKHGIRLMVCGSPEFVSENPINSPMDLVPERCIVQRTYAPRSSWTLGLDGKVYKLQLRPRMVVNDISAIYDMTLRGAGIAVLPDFLVQEDLDKGRLVDIFPAAALPEVGIYKVWPRSKANLPRIRALREHLSAALP